MLFWHRWKEEKSLVTHLSVVLENHLLFTDDITVLLLCFPDSICSALPCLMALSCGYTAKQVSRMWKQLQCGSDVVWDLHMQRWSRSDMSL